MSRKIAVGILLIVLVALSGCGGSKPASHVASAKEGLTVKETSLVEKARKDLAQRLGISEEKISLKSIESVEWPDTSLGCPEEGKMYAQVVLPGYKIVLEANGKSYEYHAGGNDLVFCQK